MKSLILSSTLILLTCVVNAQIILQPQPIDGIKFSSNEVWGVNAISTLTAPINAILIATITTESGKAVAQLNSGVLVVYPGTNNFNVNNVSTQSLKYQNQDFGNYESKNGFLPSGSYNYCLKIVCADKECDLLYRTEENNVVCADVIGIVPSPLLLSYPPDQEILSITRPNFNWIPPMPIGADPDISYEFTLVELSKDQRPESGIRRNRPLYQTSGITQVSLAFPAELSDLEIGKHYAWRVSALLGETIIQTSDVWELEIAEEEKRLISMPFVDLRTKANEVFNAVNKANFIYDERQRSGELKIVIKDNEDNVVNENPIIMKTSLGENSMQLDLTVYDLNINERYTLFIHTTTGQVYILNVRYFFKQ